MKSDSMKKVLITGAQGALGSSVAQCFLKSDYSVAGTYLPAHSASESKIEDRSIRWIPVDLTQSQSVKKALAQESFDVLVHCAGGFRYASVESTSDDDLDFLLNTNLRSAFLLTRELLPKMKENNFGRIILISAKATLQPGAGLAAYSASKAGLNALTLALAEETKKFNITVNSVLPSIIDTPANRKAMPDSDFSKWVSTDQLAEIILTLASPLGSPVHGALIPVSGRL